MEVWRYGGIRRLRALHGGWQHGASGRVDDGNDRDQLRFDPKDDGVVEVYVGWAWGAVSESSSKGSGASLAAFVRLEYPWQSPNLATSPKSVLDPEP